MTVPRPHIDDILTSFFARECEGTKGVTRQRTELVERLLRECLEAEGARVLVDRDRIMLAAEHEFQPEGAFARTMHADDLIFVLPLFVQPPWLHSEPLVQRIQLYLTDALTGHIMYGGLADYDQLICQLYDIRNGIDSAKWALNRDRRDRQRVRRHSAAAERAATEQAEYDSRVAARPPEQIACDERYVQLAGVELARMMADPDSMSKVTTTIQRLKFERATAYAENGWSVVCRPRQRRSVVLR